VVEVSEMLAAHTKAQMRDKTLEQLHQEQQVCVTNSV
jgi:hypothetical protein